MITDIEDADEDRRLVAWLREGEIAIDCRVGEPTGQLAVVIESLLGEDAADLEWYGLTITAKRARLLRSELKILLAKVEGGSMEFDTESALMWHGKDSEGVGLFILDGMVKFDLACGSVHNAIGLGFGLCPAEVRQLIAELDEILVHVELQ